MAQASRTPDEGANKVPATSGGRGAPGDHDRVVMLSLKADGTPDQHGPEIIGDPESAKAAARHQFSEQAVSALDVEVRGVAGGGPVTIVGTEGDGPDEVRPLTTNATGGNILGDREGARDLRAEQEKVAKAAADLGAQAVEKLHNGLR